MTYNFYVMLVQTPALGAILVYNNGWNISLPSLNSLPWFIGGGFAYAAGLAFLPLALKTIDASIVGTIQYTGLIWGSFLGFLIFQEIPTQTTIIGATIIVISGMYLIYREQKTVK